MTKKTDKPEWYCRHWPSWPFIVIMLVSGIYAALNAQMENTLAMLSGVAIAFLPPLLEKWWRVRFAWWMQLALTLLAFLTLRFGVMNGTYEQIPIWDDFMHAYSGLVSGIFGIVLVEKIVAIWAPNLPYVMRIVFVVMFGASLALGWEIAEFMSDQLFGLDSQHHDLYDTMTDMIYGTLGALVIAAGYYGGKISSAKSK